AATGAAQRRAAAVGGHVHGRLYSVVRHPADRRRAVGHDGSPRERLSGGGYQLWDRRRRGGDVEAAAQRRLISGPYSAGLRRPAGSRCTRRSDGMPIRVTKAESNAKPASAKRPPAKLPVKSFI